MNDSVVRSVQYEGLFKAWNLQYELVPAMPIADIGRDDSTQVRELAHRAIPANVEQYALQMKNGTEFPPVVIWAEQRWLLDGNTRLSAAKRIGLETFAVYRVSIPFLAMAKALTAALQELSGQKLTSDERRAAALNMIELDFSDASIGATLGVTAESARQWRRLHEVAERAERTGTAEQIAKMNKTNRLALAKITHDEPFRELVMAIADGKPDVKEVREVAEQVATATSDDAALGVVGEARAQWVPLGPEPRKTRVNRRAQQARMHIGGLLALGDSELIDHAKAADDLARWEQLAVKASRMVELLAQESAA